MRAEDIPGLKKHYPDAHYYIDFKTPLDLLVAAILSAQVRDKYVNAVTPALFAKFQTAKDYANSTVEELILYLKGISFPGNKSRNIIAACKILVEKYDGKVPDTIDDLTSLPGIGRKTALAILSNAFNKVEGIVVDTHVLRVSYRLGWTNNTNPEKVGADLEREIPRKDWQVTPWLLKSHGRAICKAPIPSCSTCFLKDTCPKNGVTKKK
jgi:endonuclease-3